MTDIGRHEPQDGATIAVGAALDWEVRAVLRALQRNAIRIDAIGRFVWRARVGDRDVVVYRTGIGVKSARRSTRETIGRFNPVLIINSGCAGGLSPTLRSGDLIAPTRVVGPAPDLVEWQTSPPARHALVRVATAAAATSGEHTSGEHTTLATSRSPLLDRTAKEELATQTGACAVDMEGSGVAEVAAARHTHFASLRAILDPLEADLPDLRGLFDYGKPARLRFVGRSLASPRTGYRLLELAWRSRLAARSLRRAHTRLFTAIRAGELADL